MTPDERGLRKAVTKTILGLLVFAIVIFLLSLLFSCRLKGEAESRAKDAFSKACQFYENYVPEDYLPVNRPIL